MGVLLSADLCICFKLLALSVKVRDLCTQGLRLPQNLKRFVFVREYEWLYTEMSCYSKLIYI